MGKVADLINHPLCQFCEFLRSLCQLKITVIFLCFMICLTLQQFRYIMSLTVHFVESDIQALTMLCRWLNALEMQEGCQSRTSKV